jgi:hypothetical protein
MYHDQVPLPVAVVLGVAQLARHPDLNPHQDAVSAGR